MQRPCSPLPLLVLVLVLAAAASAYRPPAEWRYAGVLDHHLATTLLPLRSAVPAESGGKLTIRTSIDLGKSQASVGLDSEGISAGANLLATWAEIETIAEERKGCWALYDDGSKPWRISAISKSTNIPASLCPPLSSSGAPTMILGGFTMHRIAGDDMNPTKDTAAKISAVASSIFPGASVLDTCCGLGYTAIAAAELVGPQGRVTTIEFDEASLEMCAFNPWSQPLFDGSLPIDVLQGDSCEVVKNEFESRQFSAIIHDPPARALTRNDLYGLEFYKTLRRVLKPSGTLFHYIGRSDSKESGRLYKGIQERLIEAGFATVKPYDAAFGLVASGIRQTAGGEGGAPGRGLFNRRKRAAPTPADGFDASDDADY